MIKRSISFAITLSLCKDTGGAYLCLIEISHMGHVAAV